MKASCCRSCPRRSVFRRRCQQVASPGLPLGAQVCRRANGRHKLFVHVLLLDADQLRVIARLRGRPQRPLRRGGAGRRRIRSGQPRFGFSTLAYLRVDPVFVSHLLDSPIAFEAVRASGRHLPEFETTQCWRTSSSYRRSTRFAPWSAPGSKSADEDLTGPREVASELMRYLNGQSWYRQHTGQRRLLACERLESHSGLGYYTSRTSSTRELWQRVRAFPSTRTRPTSPIPRQVQARAQTGPVHRHHRSGAPGPVRRARRGLGAFWSGWTGPLGPRSRRSDCMICEGRGRG